MGSAGKEATSGKQGDWIPAFVAQAESFRDEEVSGKQWGRLSPQHGRHGCYNNYDCPLLQVVTVAPFG